MADAEVDAGLVMRDYQPITPAEAALVVQRFEQADGERTLAEIVTDIENDRVGPAAHWKENYMASSAMTDEPSAEDQTGVPSEPSEPPADDDDDQLEGWVRTIVDGEDDDLAVWLDEHNVDQVIDAVSSTPDDLRALAADRVADAEQARGDDARTTLLDRLARFTTTEEA